MTLIETIKAQTKELDRIASMPLSEWVNEQKEKVDIDSETGNVSEYHRDRCNGCSLCEE